MKLVVFSMFIFLIFSHFSYAENEGEDFILRPILSDGEVASGEKTGCGCYNPCTGPKPAACK